MRRIKSKDTKPELLVRKAVHAMGYRYRLHRRELPGKPDMVFGPRRKVIFVHGCFWHGHDDPNCPDRREVKSNQEYWLPKIARNRERDRERQARLAAEGWDVLTVWECKTREKTALERILKEFLEGDSSKLR